MIRRLMSIKQGSEIYLGGIMYKVTYINEAKLVYLDEYILDDESDEFVRSGERRLTLREIENELRAYHELAYHVTVEEGVGVNE